MGHEYPYTDEDVRGDESLLPLAEEYVKNYTDTFAPLLKAKEYLEDNGSLSVIVARMVLNCMRHDFTVCDRMPKPERKMPVDFDDLDRKIGLKPRKKKPVCLYTVSHERHWLEGNQYCEGVSFPISREYYTDHKVSIKAPFAVAQTGSLVHKCTGEGLSRWYVKNVHAWGHYRVELIVDLVCIYPSILHGPILFMKEPDYNLIFESGRSKRMLKPCKHCFDGE